MKAFALYIDDEVLLLTARLALPNFDFPSNTAPLKSYRRQRKNEIL